MYVSTPPTRWIRTIRPLEGANAEKLVSHNELMVAPMSSMLRVAVHSISRSRGSIRWHGPCRNSLWRASSSWNWNDSRIVDDKSSTSDAAPSTAPDAAIQKQVLDTCANLHSSIMPLNEKLRGPLAKNSDQNTALPLVFLVGNHSSGKSSFVNFIMGRNVQTAGVAPTDDNFTVIAPGAFILIDNVLPRDSA